MTPSLNLHRRLCLIRWTKKPYTYPTKKELSERLNDLGIGANSLRTIERDMEKLRDEYSIDIRHDNVKNGYYLYVPSDEDVEDFNQFVSLLERRERLDFLQSAVTSIRDAGNYLQFERNEQFIGAGCLPVLWEALRCQKVVQFEYASYAAEHSIPTIRKVEPGILFEYRNRWYLDAWDIEKGGIRTFGLDRMGNPMVVGQTISTKRTAVYKALRKQVIGVTIPTGAMAEQVVLRFNKLEAKYVQSLPLHSSQRTVQETNSHVDIALLVVLNHELEREILAFGEAVEVLEPAYLRETITRRVSQVGNFYS
ncbi:putative DNA-binding transcriptional regulator YafY [Dyadobacter jejuensis]|uniref:Putative DNA-binding transcriptional regulator YafY n=1 Tax=Dyadobacter jejuensis TaxID=1082580 RepID=A0A316ADW0_9BACT|nr:putative DNA-binding transcriptional regulator YafY [Dyadobacter jejuensis]